MASVCSLFLVAGQAHAAYFEDLEVELGVGYKSRHVVDGIEEVENGVYETELVFGKDFEGFGGVFIKMEALGGVTSSYGEAEAGIGVNYGITDDLSAELVYLWYHKSPHSGTNKDLEGALSYGGFGWADLSAGFLKALRNGGDMWWVGVSRSFAWGDVEVTPSVAAYYDAGYVSKEYDGLNNIQYNVEAAWDIADQMTFVMNANYSHAQKNITRDGDVSGDGIQESPVWFDLFLVYEF